ncbi:hypothetical protein [Nakamurella multipartita]|uniref:CRISPR-associated protein n=1 Tax=Nakamurella multipartita (strain ATCC 700099 / DSM 44233 / CIP 104796 / JCM 9543 / NBRC 105858 / Y-104) TaxID=479431 RepID=C8XDI6_NAKMY|nr:hypothetical protein [Nakamurella multipartita]ACV77650.1 hypothetical protein Namu_1246 [Nakamurella multipartita DSM 44233]
MPQLDSTSFVNPYTFVAISDVIPRRRPPGHDGGNRLGPNGQPLYSGSLDVTWTLATPMLLPAGEISCNVDGAVQVPGASVKGAVRSLHEAMFRGCLRVVDEGFLPSYRQIAGSKPQPPWRLGVVQRSTAAGKPIAIKLCEETVWVDGPSLLAAYGRQDSSWGEPRTGDAFCLEGDEEWSTLERWEMRTVESARGLIRPSIDRDDSGELALGSELPENHAVVLLTDIGARRKVTKAGKRGRCLWATGILGGKSMAVAPEAWEIYRQSCDGADDRRRLLAPPKAESGRRIANPRSRVASSGGDSHDRRRFAEVKWWGTYADGNRRESDVRIGWRSMVTGFLFPGEVVWVLADGEKVTRIEHSAIWRELGAQPLSERVPRQALPCTDPAMHAPELGERQGLCLSCEIFGSVDPKGTDQGGQQTAYAGHVRFGTATAEPGARVEQIDLAPLGAPRLGAGMFSLQDRSLTSRRGGSPPGQWGSASDKPRPRGLRGRKFYWNSDPDEQAAAWTGQLQRSVSVTPRHQRRPSQREFGGRRDLLAPGTTLRQTIRFDALSPAGLHSLLAVLDPARVLPALGGPGYHVRLGGGRPFGLGAVAVRIESCTIETIGDRYRRAEPAPAGPPPAHDPAAVSGYLDQAACVGLARILNPHGLGDDRHLVSYPPGDVWERVNTQRFDESYRFFTENNGQQFKTRVNPWAPLPTLPTTSGEAFRASQPIHPSGGR